MTDIILGFQVGSSLLDHKPMIESEIKELPLNIKDSSETLLKLVKDIFNQKNKIYGIDRDNEEISVVFDTEDSGSKTIFLSLISNDPHAFYEVKNGKLLKEIEFDNQQELLEYVTRL